MDKTSKSAHGVQEVVLSSVEYCRRILLLNLPVAFSELPASAKLGFALVSWIVMTATGATAATMWRIRKG